MKVNNYLNLLLENMLELIVYLIRITKISQLDLKHPCDLCDYSDAYILVKATIAVAAPGANNDTNNIRDKKYIINIKKQCTI